MRVPATLLKKNAAKQASDSLADQLRYAVHVEEVIENDEQAESFRTQKAGAAGRSPRNQIATPGHRTGRSNPEDPGSLPDVCHRNDLPRPSYRQHPFSGAYRI